MTPQIPSKQVTHYDIPTALRGEHRRPCACVECRAADEMERLRARNDELERANVGLATESERRRAVLERLTDGYKYPTEVCQIAREALSGESASSVETSDTRCGDEVRLKCAQPKGHDGLHESQAGLQWAPGYAQKASVAQSPLSGCATVMGGTFSIAGAAQPTPGSGGIFCVHGFTEWHTACPKCESSKNGNEDANAP